MSPVEFSRLMNRFYEATTKVLIETDAFIDKLVGDEVMALYLPLFAGVDHAGSAVRAAQALLHATGYTDPDGPWLPVGVGVHTGVAYVGTVRGAEGTVTDITALGDTVNTTARLASKAGSGEVLVSEAAFLAAGLKRDDHEQRAVELKGKALPLNVCVLRA